MPKALIKYLNNYIGLLLFNSNTALFSMKFEYLVLLVHGTLGVSVQMK